MPIKLGFTGKDNNLASVNVWFTTKNTHSLKSKINCNPFPTCRAAYAVGRKTHCDGNRGPIPHLTYVIIGICLRAAVYIMSQSSVWRKVNVCFSCHRSRCIHLASVHRRGSSSAVSHIRSAANLGAKWAFSRFRKSFARCHACASTQSSLVYEWKIALTSCDGSE